MQEFQEASRVAFLGTGKRITTHGNRIEVLSSVYGHSQKRTSVKVEKWVSNIKNMAKIVVSQPYAAYVAYIHGLSHRWLYIVRTIRDKFLLAMTGACRS